MNFLLVIKLYVFCSVCVWWVCNNTHTYFSLDSFIFSVFFQSFSHWQTVVKTGHLALFRPLDSPGVSSLSCYVSESSHSACCLTLCLQRSSRRELKAIRREGEIKGEGGREKQKRRRWKWGGGIDYPWEIVSSVLWEVTAEHKTSCDFGIPMLRFPDSETEPWISKGVS